MSGALDFTYKYAFPSGLAAANDGGAALSLATCDLNHETPYFFDGKVRSPRILGDMLVTLSDVVRTHFFLPVPPLLDPVLTSNENLLRLEGFSGCCGVYARADLPAEFFDGNCHGRGTTNVDFNTPMRTALMRLRDSEDVRFAVGKDEVALTKGNHKTVEKKVKLPVRWIKSFSEVQAYQPALELKMEVSAADALRFCRTLPKSSSTTKTPKYAISVGRSIRLSARPQKGAVKFMGTHRVKVIESLLPRAKSLRVWADDATGTSAWEVLFPTGSFFLMISPEVFRGFSGEGQALSALANPPSDEIVAKVRAQLKWESEIAPETIAKKAGIKPADAKAALTVLGSRGLAGYDVTGDRFFHRELPFDLSKVEQLQPRLKNARKLVEKGSVLNLGQEKDATLFQVPGTDVTHRVKISDKGDSCTCPWFSKYLGERGPCKHVLAARIVLEDEPG